MQHYISNRVVNKIVFYFMSSNLQDQSSQVICSTSFFFYLVKNALLISAALLNTSGGDTRSGSRKLVFFELLLVIFEKPRVELYNPGYTSRSCFFEVISSFDHFVLLILINSALICFNLFTYFSVSFF